jgi:CBS domain containing-hemolysin-like protein
VTEVLVPILVIAVLILLNGLFVAAEFAVVAARSSRLDQLVKEGNLTAKAVQEIVSSARNQDRFIAIAQLGITLATIGLGMYGEPAIAGWIYGPIERAFGVSEAVSHTIGTVVAVSIMTYFHVVVGEMIPKALALGTPETTAVAVARPMQVVGTIFYPLVLLLNTIATGLLRLLRIPVNSERRFYTPNELELLVQESHEQGLVPDEQQQIIRNIFDFGELAVYQLMTPRTQVTGIELQSRPEDIWALLRSSQQSRFPVFDRDLDHVVGILHIKDFLKQQQRADPFDLRKLVRVAPRVAETARAETLLASFKRLKVHMAVVVDEHGGTAGVITMDDLLEEVVGDVDNGATTAADLQRQDDGSFLMPGDLAIDAFAEATGLTLASEHSETVAGLMLEHLGRAPRVGDQTSVGAVTLTVEAVEGLLITRIRATTHPATEAKMV